MDTESKDVLASTDDHHRLVRDHLEELSSTGASLVDAIASARAELAQVQESQHAEAAKRLEWLTEQDVRVSAREAAVGEREEGLRELMVAIEGGLRFRLDQLDAMTTLMADERHGINEQLTALRRLRTGLSPDGSLDLANGHANPPT